MSRNWFHFPQFEYQLTLKYTQKHALFTYGISGPNVQRGTDSTSSNQWLQLYKHWIMHTCLYVRKLCVLQEDWSLSARPGAHEDAAADTNCDPSRRSPPHTPHYLQAHTITLGEHYTGCHVLFMHACWWKPEVLSFDWIYLQFSLSSVIKSC